ncbi:sulfotransferase family 2 domain-containing protein [Roseivirga misakiensis]|uniref:Sulfotransferase domain-containing protein n=1 Tax=Roseivirga misakiensis TaxID=1563681 RepID=A0A1E5T1M6_9BACT|nr:sulfotransferase family 2 domain-containing protein [Roseivirga misakiensis]OEK05207.1 hypothetical protein BFP71_17540 [Roseivirga misakiensis]
MKELIFNKIYRTNSTAVVSAFGFYKFNLRKAFERDLANFDHSRKILFVHNPKAAGNSVLDVLGLRKANFKSSHSTPSFLVPKSIWEEYFSIVAVRHPIDRFLSSYFYHTKPEYNGIFKSKYPGLESFSLNQYFEVFKSEPFVIRPQVDYLKHHLSDKPVDFIMKLEDLDTDIERLSSQLKFLLKTLSRKNTSKRSNMDLSEHKALISDLKAFYSRDFEALGYSSDLDTLNF